MSRLLESARNLPLQEVASGENDDADLLGGELGIVEGFLDGRCRPLRERLVDGTVVRRPRGNGRRMADDRDGGETGRNPDAVDRIENGRRVPADDGLDAFQIGQAAARFGPEIRVALNNDDGDALGRSRSEG